MVVLFLGHLQISVHKLWPLQDQIMYERREGNQCFYLINWSHHIYTWQVFIVNRQDLLVSSLENSIIVWHLLLILDEHIIVTLISHYSICLWLLFLRGHLETDSLFKENLGICLYIDNGIILFFVYFNLLERQIDRDRDRDLTSPGLLLNACNIQGWTGQTRSPELHLDFPSGW